MNTRVASILSVNKNLTTNRLKIDNQRHMQLQMFFCNSLLSILNIIYYYKQRLGLYLAVATRGAFPGQVEWRGGGRPWLVTPHVRTDTAVVKRIRYLQRKVPNNFHLRSTQFAKSYLEIDCFTSMENNI